AWRTTADEIQADILKNGINDKGVLKQHYATGSLDASVLLAAIFGFLPPDDDRLRATVHAIADDLTENGFVLSYRTDETDDGLSGKEGTFLICSFWLVSALAIVGDIPRARDLMERLLRVASPLGLYAEAFDTSTTALQQPAVRTAVSEYLVDQLYANVNVPKALSGALPSRLQPLAGPIAVGAEPYIQRAVAAGLARPRVVELWRAANLRAHGQL